MAKTRGGGLLIVEATGVVKSCRFTRNSADGSGGGVSIISGGNLQLIDSQFDGNRAIFFPASQGGALNSDGSELWATNCHFKANEAKNGGAVALGPSCGTSTLEGCVFASNNGSARGGGRGMSRVF